MKTQRKLGQFFQTLTASFFVILLLKCIVVAGNGCQRRFIILAIQKPGCMPRNIMASACKGTCTSYSRPSTEHFQSLEYFCQCCDSIENVYRRAFVACPNMDWSPGQPRYRRIHVQMNLPRACRCRPCSQTPQYIIPAEAEFWGNAGKRMGTGNMYNRLASNVTQPNRMSAPFIHIDNPDIKFSVKYV